MNYFYVGHSTSITYVLQDHQPSSRNKQGIFQVSLKSCSVQGSHFCGEWSPSFMSIDDIVQASSTNLISQPHVSFTWLVSASGHVTRLPHVHVSYNGESSYSSLVALALDTAALQLRKKNSQLSANICTSLGIKGRKLGVISVDLPMQMSGDVLKVDLWFTRHHGHLVSIGLLMSLMVSAQLTTLSSASVEWRA